MKTKLTFLISLSALLICISQITFAEIVPIEKAKQVAVNFYSERASSIKSISKEAITITDEIIISNGNDNVYYIFNIGQDNGFIIVSAEDNVNPVLAYSFEKNYPTNINIPSANWILNSYKNEIINSRLNKTKASDKIKNLWTKYSSNTKSTSSTNEVLPLLGSINWDQSCYYNALCPAGGNLQGYCNHVPTGCVATAMAMIMKYNAYPTQGTGSFSYNDSKSDGYTDNYGTLSANFGATIYNWANMPYVVNSSNSDVATLMYQCGVSVGMDYDINGSGAVIGVSSSSYSGPTAEKALKTYFNYTTAIYHMKSSYTESQWQSLILNDLNAGRPILYGGDNGGTSPEGHCFVLDGYQTDFNNNYHYHFNFGWSGMGNGYFYIDTINPGTGGVGGGTYDFSSDQEAIFNIAKSAAGIENIDKPEINIYPNPSSNGIFNIKFPDLNTSNADIRVFNLLGEQVWYNYYSLQNNSLNIDLNLLLSKGVYFLTIKTNSTTTTKKITILK